MLLGVEGLKDTTRAFEQAGVEVEDLKDVMGGIATEAAGVMKGFIPVASGRARDSIRGNRAKGKAIVTLGGARVPYAQVLRSTHPSKFVPRTDDVMETRSVDMLTEGWNDIAKRNGLTQ